MAAQFLYKYISVPGETPRPLMRESSHLFLHWEPPDTNPTETVNALGAGTRHESPQGAPAPTLAPKRTFYAKKSYRRYAPEADTRTGGGCWAF